MTTTTTKIATAADTILGIDLGKYKSVACLYRRANATVHPPGPLQRRGVA